jgi:hypothetical protein
MAGAGYKDFTTGEVLTAANVDNYLMEQSVMVFADAAARTTALASVLAEGMISYLKDTNSTEYYSGSAWVAIGGTPTITFAGCRLEKSANQSIANSTDTSLTWDTETFDTNTFHSTVTNTSRITIPSGKAGYYQFNVNIGWAASSTGIRDLNISKNGTRFQYFTFNGQATNSQSFAYSATAYGTVGDYFEIVVFQNSGGALNILSNVLATGTSSFSCAYLGA